MVAGPLCESGDVFTRDDRELLDPRSLPRPEPGDLLVLHDAGAYGAAMSSNYVSLGRAPQVFWEGGKTTLIARAKTSTTSPAPRSKSRCERALGDRSYLRAVLACLITRSLMLRYSTLSSWSCRSMWPLVGLPKAGHSLNLLAATFAFQSALPFS